MVELRIPKSEEEYEINSVYIFNYGTVEILTFFLREEDNYNIFKTTEGTYKHVLDSRIIPNKHKVHVIRQDFGGVVIKEEVNFKDIKVSY